MITTIDVERRIPPSRNLFGKLKAHEHIQIGYETLNRVFCSDKKIEPLNDPANPETRLG